jgi:flavin reductase (DIM6/NTAB) family NADH-FMN oxidoreductase RutF
MKVKSPLSLDKRAWQPSPLAGQIVLVTTLNADESSNVAPKSWISMMAFDPALLAFGCSLQHVTARNILRTGEFVVNFPGEDLAPAVFRCGKLPHPRPVEAVGLTARPAEAVRPPLVEECRAHLECVLYQEQAFGNEVVFFGNIVAGSVDAEALAASDPYSYLRPMVFLEEGAYGVIERARRLPESRVG